MRERSMLIRTAANELGVSQEELRLMVALKQVKMAYRYGKIYVYLDDLKQKLKENNANTAR